MANKPKRPEVTPFTQSFPMGWIARFDEIMNNQELVEQAAGNDDYLTALRNRDLASLKVTIDPYNTEVQQQFISALHLVEALEVAFDITPQPPQAGQGS